MLHLSFNQLSHFSSANLGQFLGSFSSGTFWSFGETASSCASLTQFLNISFFHAFFSILLIGRNRTTTRVFVVCGLDRVVPAFFSSSTNAILYYYYIIENIYKEKKSFQKSFF